MHIGEFNYIRGPLISLLQTRGSQSSQGMFTQWSHGISVLWWRGRFRGGAAARLNPSFWLCAPFGSSMCAGSSELKGWSAQCLLRVPAFKQTAAVHSSPPSSLPFPVNSAARERRAQELYQWVLCSPLLPFFSLLLNLEVEKSKQVPELRESRDSRQIARSSQWAHVKSTQQELHQHAG